MPNLMDDRGMQILLQLAKALPRKSGAYAVQPLPEIPCARWRDDDAADTMRFYALRLRETGDGDQGVRWGGSSLNSARRTACHNLSVR